MSDIDRSSWPFWVRAGLWGLPTRAAAMLCVWLSIALAAGGVAGGFFNPLFFLGGVFVLAAPWYWLAIRWVDRHGQWK